MSDFRDTNRVIGAGIKAARKAQKLSPSELGEVIGLGPVQMGRIERGEVPVPFDRLVALADHLRVPITYFTERLAPPGEAMASHYERQALRDEIGEIVAEIRETEHLTSLRAIAKAFRSRRR